MDVPGTKSAVARVNSRTQPRPLVHVEFRRAPRLNDALLSRLLMQVPNVKAVRAHTEGGYMVFPVTGIDALKLNKLVDDLVELAKVIV